MLQPSLEEMYGIARSSEDMQLFKDIDTLLVAGKPLPQKKRIMFLQGTGVVTGNVILRQTGY
ncbi:MAG: hypothetical protein SCALA701_33280 [Candidatus Scalindua sp.]|nr:MAG: hypothetical protein SCALA701_33280 [Candidatus Scalindua sp.]